MKLQHKHFGEVVVEKPRLTTGGNQVYDAVGAHKKTRMLLTDQRYWGMA